MPKPKRFSVEFFDLAKAKTVEERDGTLELAGPEELYSTRDFDDEPAARLFVSELEEIKPKPPWWRIYERYDIRDGTPPEERVRGLVWDYEERIFAEAGEE